MDTQPAENILRHMGKLFGVEYIAAQAIDDLPFFLTESSDPIIIGWEIFTELLDDYGETERAVAQGLYNSRILHILARQVRMQDAEDVYQIAIASAWNSFPSFRPRKTSSWDQWLLMIAKRKLNGFLGNVYRESARMSWEEGEWFDTLALDEEEEKDERCEYVRVVAERWISGTHRRKAMFAARILAILNREDDYIGLSGTHMERYTGASRQTLNRWTKQFIMEAHNESEG